MVAQIRAFRTSDGRLYDDEETAARHEAQLKIEKWAEDSRICRGGEWDADMVVDAIMENAETLAEALNVYVRAKPRGKAELIKEVKS